MTRNQSGRWCWCCGRRRPNEHFSGRGHAHHLCRVCKRLGKEELAYRSAVRNLGRLLGPSGFVRRKHRAAFQRFLEHPNPRVRELALTCDPRAGEPIEVWSWNDDWNEWDVWHDRIVAGPAADAAMLPSDEPATDRGPFASIDETADC